MSETTEFGFKVAKLKYSEPPTSPRDYDIKAVRGFLRTMVGVRDRQEYRNILYAFDRLFPGDDATVWFPHTDDEMRYRERLFKAHKALTDAYIGLKGTTSHGALRKMIWDVMLDWPEPMVIQKPTYGTSGPGVVQIPVKRVVTVKARAKK